MNIRKYKKKALMFLMCIVLVLALTACAVQQPAVSVETATTTKESDQSTMTMETEQSTTIKQTVATTAKAENIVETTPKTTQMTQKSTVGKTTVKATTTTAGKVKMSPLKAIPVAGSDVVGSSAYQYPFWAFESLGSREDSSAPKTVTVSFEGKTYVGQYALSSLQRYKNYQKDTYTFEGGSFSINAQTGDLVRIGFSGESAGNKSKAQCQKIAFALADKYIDRDECVLEVTRSENAYIFDFQKKFEGIPTEEEMRICVCTDGKIDEFAHSMAGQFPSKKSAYSELNQQKIRKLNTDKAQTLALDKAKELLPSYNKRVLEQKKWVMLEDGEIGMIFIFRLSYQGKEPQEGEPWGTALLDILVK